uniref:Twisted gastrulation protein n=1 Tax=Isodiametra pulchra TaxID=504439 RepID=A0A2P1DV89_ISOPU|nr:twisted gastrulation protein [Isodiametra pulchra]
MNVAFLLAIFLAICQEVEADKCVKLQCISRVSLCTLLGECSCQAGYYAEGGASCPCCGSCKRCLGHTLWEACGCECLGLCSADAKPEFPRGPSTVVLFPGAVTSLFHAMLQLGVGLPWTIIHTPQYEKVASVIGMKPKGSEFESSELKKSGLLTTALCETVFFDACMPREECQTTCRSLGAGGMRFFHGAGCCSCFSADHCADLGTDHIKCALCNKLPPGL